MSFSVEMTNRLSRLIEAKTTRRGFVNRTAMFGTALIVGPGYVLRPGTAYAAVCSCPTYSRATRRECDCGDLCCDGYTEFCCQLYGQNSCPPNTVLAGWWKVDNSTFCKGAARYYMDCNQVNPPCTCGRSGACGVDGICSCRSCQGRADGCTVFRYGNCNNHITCVGPILCRVVTCSKPWEIDPGCSTVARTDNATAYHHRPCLGAPVGLDEGAAAWTTAIFGDYVGRLPTDVELAQYSTRVTNGENLSAICVALSRTDTYIRSFLDDLYRSVFGRPIDAAGAQYWTNQIRAGQKPEDVAAQLYASDEFFNSSGDSYGFIWRLYNEILGRQPEQDGFAYWVDQVDQGGDRSKITSSFYKSIESRRKRVTGLYYHFLDRAPDSGGLEYWAQRLATEDDLGLATMLSGSEEYFNKAQRRN